MPRLTDIQIRDPFIVPVAEERRYYLYGTTDLNCWGPPATGFDAYCSSDFAEWEGPFPVFRPEPGFWSDRNYWAPEVHRYGNSYYMLASFKAEGVCRGTQVLRSESPRGPFRVHSNGPVTPRDWECLDGTLFVAEDHIPWMVFCHEWVQVHDGQICAIPLTPELCAATGDPVLLFHASDAPWGRHMENQADYVTDGPFLHRCADGTLLMLWSSFCDTGYAQGVARSQTGKITGPWEQLPEPLYKGDGGHGMIFRAFDGQLYLTLHSPNETPHERAHLLPLVEEGGALRVR
jgi:hypothetical protein